MPWPEVFQAVSPETSSQLWAQICLDLRWSTQSRLRHPPNFGLRDASREVVRPVSPRTSSQLQAQICLELRWSTQSRLRHPPNFGLRDASHEVVQSVSPETSSQLSSELPRPELVHPVSPETSNYGFRDSAHEVRRPVSPQTSSQLWFQRCLARDSPASLACDILATLGSEIP